MHTARDTPTFVLQLQKRQAFLRLHSGEPLEGDSLVISGKETQTSKDAALNGATDSMCTRASVHSDAHGVDIINWVTS